MIVFEKELTERIDEVFTLPCVRGVYKNSHNKLWYMCEFGQEVVALHVGDKITQETDGSWHYRTKYEMQRDYLVQKACRKIDMNEGD